jgi:hypothetical protein
MLQPMEMCLGNRGLQEEASIERGVNTFGFYSTPLLPEAFISSFVTWGMDYDNLCF